MGTRPDEIFADKVRGLAWGYFHYASRPTRALRRKRLAQMLKGVTAANAVFKVFKQSVLDDSDLSSSPAGEAVMAYLKAAVKAKDQLQGAISDLGTPSQSDRARLYGSPLDWFTLAGQILWMEETSTIPNNRVEYRAWLSLLFEVVTGEKERSLEKPIRAIRTLDAPKSHM
jgi:hypothetical protein